MNIQNLRYLWVLGAESAELKIKVVVTGQWAEGKKAKSCRKGPVRDVGAKWGERNEKELVSTMKRHGDQVRRALKKFWI